MKSTELLIQMQVQPAGQDEQRGTAAALRWRCRTPKRQDQTLRQDNKGKTPQNVSTLKETVRADVFFVSDDILFLLFISTEIWMT